MSTEDDPATWDPKLDAAAAAAANHEVLFENDLIRVLSVTVRVGEQEPLHHHRWPSVFVVDTIGKARDFDGEGREVPLPVPDTAERPIVVRLPPQSLHCVRNDDTFAFHGTRVEFKKGFVPA